MGEIIATYRSGIEPKKLTNRKTKNAPFKANLWRKMFFMRKLHRLHGKMQAQLRLWMGGMARFCEEKPQRKLRCGSQ